MRVYLVDDEPLALKRLQRLLARAPDVEVIGATTVPEAALEFLSRNPVDALFLDIQMPGMTGFELLGKLDQDLPVIFTTAFDQYALSAFEVNSIDYLLKPIGEDALERALKKLQRLGGRSVAREIIESLEKSRTRFPERIASRVGERVVLVDIRHITHFYAKDKLTFAATPQKDYVVESPIAEWERTLDPARFARIHRSTLVSLAHVQEVGSWFAGGLVVRLKDGKRTELAVARDRAADLKRRLGIY